MINNEVLMLVIWAYRQGYLDAIKTLHSAEAAIDEKALIESMKKQLEAAATKEKSE